MKIGLVLAYKGVNYGMLLQAFATQEAIKKLGYETEILDYTRTDFKHIRVTPFIVFYLIYEYKRKKKLKNRNLQQIEFDSVHKDNLSERKKVSNLFIDTKLENKVKCNGIIELEQYAQNIDGVLVGSDQLWSPDSVFGNFVTLRFVPEKINKISYATSLGVSKYPFWCNGSASNFLKRINHISVREEQGREIISKLCKSSVEVVVDPTYLFSKDEWSELIPNRKLIEDKYLLCYFLGETQEHKKLARAYADKNGLKLVSILSTESTSELDLEYADEIITGKGPEDFINLIRYAECVMTDSFHGVAFSVINNIDFYVFYRTLVNSKGSRNSRIDNILTMWGLKNRLVLNNANVDMLPTDHIDYCKVNKIVDKRRVESIEYLSKALRDCK